MWKCIGCDPNGIPRAWGSDYTPDGAKEQCGQEAVEYIRARPDTGPLEKWQFGLVEIN